MSIEQLFQAFNHGDAYKSHQPITFGHINTTYKINSAQDNAYVLQKLNTSVFTDIHALIENKVSVTCHLNAKELFKVSTYFTTKNGEYVFIDSDNSYWTLSTFIANSKTFLTPENETMVYQAGITIGQFYKGMANFDSGKLHEILPGFHDFSFRLHQFKEAQKNASDALLNEVKDLIEFSRNHETEASKLHVLKSSGEIPIRVTHNDAKLSNILFDTDSLKAIALIDFDTVMPGIVHYDFGDAVRSICSTAFEDEQDLVKVSFNMSYYEALIEGFAAEISNDLSDAEIKHLPLSSYYIIYLQGLRFLTDYLNGNTYYAIAYPKHNLVRAKNQFKLLKVIHRKREEIKSITYRVFNV